MQSNGNSIIAKLMCVDECILVQNVYVTVKSTSHVACKLNYNLWHDSCHTDAMTCKHYEERNSFCIASITERQAEVKSNAALNKHVKPDMCGL